jgi:excisionase family DNA binding protein
MARLLTAREVAATLGVNPETVLRWTRRGDLEAVRLPGGQLRYRSDTLGAWLGERTVNGREAGGGVTAPTALPVRGVVSQVSPPHFEEDPDAP